MRRNRILAFLLVLCLLSGILAGCNRTTEDPNSPSSTPSNGKPSSGTQTSENVKQTSAKYYYTAEYVPLTIPLEKNETLNYINMHCISGNYLYMTAEISVRIVKPDAEIPEVPVEDEIAGEDVPESPDASLDEEMGVMPLDTEVDVAVDEIYSTSNETYSYKSILCRYDLTTGKSEALPGYSVPEYPEGYSDGWTGINRVAPGSNNSIWICDSMSCYKIIQNPKGEEINGISYNDGDYVEGPSIMRYQQFSAEGEVLFEKSEVRDPYSDAPSSKNLNLIDNRDRFYFYDWENGEISIEDKDGNVLHAFALENGYLTEFCENPAIQVYDEERGSYIQLIDMDTLELGEVIETPHNAYSFSISNDEAYDFYYQYNSDLYGYKQKEAISEQVVSWMDCDVNTNDLYEVFPLSDGRILGLLNEMDEETYEPSYTMVFLTKTDASNIKPKTVLTLACMYTPWDIRDEILKFNRNSEDYRIIVVDYSQYATDEDYYAGLTKLNTEILSGQVPDLIYTANLPIARYAAQGILADLRPFIDADPELCGDQLMTHVLDAASYEGKLYQAFESFTIQAPIALEAVVGEYDQWTLNEVKDAMTKLQPDASVFAYHNTRKEVFSMLFQRNFNSYVNWETGECSFDGEDFRDMLEFVNSFPDEFDYENFDYSSVKYGATALLAGVQLLEDTGLYGLHNYVYTLAEYNGHDFTFIGYPSASGNNTNFTLSQGLCIGANCADPEGAWQFVRTLFTKEYQQKNSWGNFPTNAEVFYDVVEEMMTVEYEMDADGNYLLDENGEKIVSMKAYTWDEMTGEQTGGIEAMTQEQIDQVMELYERTNMVETTDSEIMTIVEEVTEGYFAGQKSLDETVRVLQNRVSLYVSEQK